MQTVDEVLLDVLAQLAEGESQLQLEAETALILVSSRRAGLPAPAPSRSRRRCPGCDALAVGKSPGPRGCVRPRHEGARHCAGAGDRRRHFHSAGRVLSARRSHAGDAHEDFRAGLPGHRARRKPAWEDSRRPGDRLCQQGAATRSALRRERLLRTLHASHGMPRRHRRGWSVGMCASALARACGWTARVRPSPSPDPWTT